MADKRWKANERSFAEFFANALGVEVRRNDAIYRAGDKCRNSDVDVIHKKLEIVRGGSVCYHGITGELKYSSSNHVTLYRWLKEETNAVALKKRGKGRFTVLVLNKEFIAFWLDDFFFAYDCFVKGIYKHHEIARFAHIVHKQVSYQFKGLDQAAGQASRYAHELNLFPVPCIRLKGQKQIALFRISDIEESMSPRVLTKYKGSTLEVEAEAEDDAPDAVPDAIQEFTYEVEKAVAPVVGRQTTERLRIQALNIITGVRARPEWKGVALPQVAVSPSGEDRISITVSKEVSVDTSSVKRKRLRREKKVPGSVDPVTGKKLAVKKPTPFQCSNCGRYFKSPQALGGHLPHCRKES